MSTLRLEAAPCLLAAHGAECIDGAPLPTASNDRFGAAAPLFPTDVEIRAAGNLAAALAARGLPVPRAICCGQVALAQYAICF